MAEDTAKITTMRRGRKEPDVVVERDHESSTEQLLVEFAGAPEGSKAREALGSQLLARIASAGADKSQAGKQVETGGGGGGPTWTPRMVASSIMALATSIGVIAPTTEQVLQRVIAPSAVEQRLEEMERATSETQTLVRDLAVYQVQVEQARVANTPTPDVPPSLRIVALQQQEREQ
jgi:hypothetical protein